MLTKLFIASLAFFASSSLVEAQTTYPCGTTTCSAPIQTACVVGAAEAFGNEQIELTYCAESNTLCGLQLPILASMLLVQQGGNIPINGLATAAEYNSPFFHSGSGAGSIAPNTFFYDGVSQVSMNIAFELDYVSTTTVDAGLLFQLYGTGLTTTPSSFSFNTNVPVTGTTPTSGISQPLISLTVTGGGACKGYVTGDPQFVGLRGQSYQVHGVDGGIYNLVSSVRTQVNAQFAFLSEGVCPMIDGVAQANCWSHPGSYLGAISVQQMLPDGSVQKLIMIAGPAKQGFASLILNGKKLHVGDSFAQDVFSLSYDSTHSISVKTEQLSFTFDNSDMFINQAVSAAVPLSKMNAHGLLGQTSEAKIYSSPLRYIAGQVDDYLVSSNDMFATDFVYNKFSSIA